MVGDGMQCPPSPLLFDPSVTLDPSLRDMAEAPIDILALEEPDRGSSSTPLLPAAEGAAQVGLGVAAPSPLRDGLSQQEPPLSSRQARGAPLPPSLGVPMVWVALGVPGWGGSQRPTPRWLCGWLSATLVLGMSVWDTGDVWAGALPAVETSSSQLGVFSRVVSQAGSSFFLEFYFSLE